MIACQDASTTTEPGTRTDYQGAEFRICQTDEVGDVGAAAVMLGMSIQEPNRTDMHGDTIDESPAGARWMNLRAFFRFPAGTDSYTLSAWDDPEVIYFLDEFRSKYPGVPNDQTWPPQLPIEDFENWLHDDVQRITLGNEPPLHDDPFPAGFPSGDSYVALSRSSQPIRSMPIISGFKPVSPRSFATARWRLRVLPAIRIF